MPWKQILQIKMGLLCMSWLNQLLCHISCIIAIGSFKLQTEPKDSVKCYSLERLYASMTPKGVAGGAAGAVDHLVTVSGHVGHSFTGIPHCESWLNRTLWWVCGAHIASSQGDSILGLPTCSLHPYCNFLTASLAFSTSMGRWGFVNRFTIFVNPLYEAKKGYGRE